MSIYDFTVLDIQGLERTLSDYKGKVLLVVNTASQCGFTPQYAGLEQIYEALQADGFEVLGFPCNQFARQEQGSDRDIASFCRKNYGVSFTMFAKIEVNGEQAHPLYRYLKEASPGILGSQGIKWNFTKFLIGRDGKVVKRFAPTVKPAAIKKHIEALLA
ncbi:MAG: glutathione peroxidase [Cycloclasticus sp.]